MTRDQPPASADPYLLADEAAATIRARSGVDTHDLAIVLGSGWASAAERLGEVRCAMALDSVPGYVAPTVAGHTNQIYSLDADGQSVLAFGARSHLYEGCRPQTVVHAVRTAAAAGCRGIILTNAAGSVRPEWQPGQLVLISDHINLTGSSPMVGDPPGPGRPDRFCDLTEVYSVRLPRDVGALARLPQGVYAGLLGGNYETPAEIRMLATMGVDLVGMSTVLEAIAARHLGLEVLGLSLVTNPAAGVGTDLLRHTEVLDTAAAAREEVIDLLAEVITHW